MLLSWRSLTVCLYLFALVVCSRASPPPAHEKRANGYDAPETNAVDEQSHSNFQHFVTRPDIIVPRWQIIVHNDTALADGYWFVAPYQDVYQKKPSEHVGPMIYDGKGELVWSGNPLLRGWNAFGFTKTEVGGKDMLSLVHNHEAGVLLNDRYEIVKKSTVGGLFNTWELNMHEFAVVENGSRLLHMRSKEVSTSRRISAEIGYSGRCYVHFQGFEERDAETLETIFEWDSEGVIPLNDTFVDVRPVETRCSEQPYDYAHCNSLGKLPSGDYIIGCRHTDTVYAISHLDGSILWRFGGSNRTKSDFEWISRTFRPVAGFAGSVKEWIDDSHFGGQHDAKVWEANNTHILLGMLDNAFRIGSERTSHPFSRGLLIQLDLVDMTAKVIHEYAHPEALIADGRGSFQLLESGNAFVGFSQYSAIAEYAHDGTLLMEAKVHPRMKSYRAYKHPWTGHPTLPPDVYSAVFADDEGKYQTSIWMSWNGATEVRSWEVHRAQADGSTELVVTTRKTGFETAITIDEYISHIVVTALDGGGARLGESRVVKTIGPAALVEGLDNDDVGWVRKHPPKVVEFLRRPEVAFITGLVVCGLTVLAAFGAWWCTRYKGRGAAWWKREAAGAEAHHLLRPLSGETDDEAVLDERFEPQAEAESEESLLKSESEEWDKESKQRLPP